MNYQEILNKLRKCEIKNNNDQIDIVYYLQIFENKSICNTCIYLKIVYKNFLFKCFNG